jgi:hypothetical protein
MTTTITFNGILERVQDRRPCSPASARRYLRKLKIKPLGTIRTKPLYYPGDTPDRILFALGEKVVTMSQLRAVKRQAQKARAV